MCDVVMATRKHRPWALATNKPVHAPIVFSHENRKEGAYNNILWKGVLRVFDKEDSPFQT